MSDKNERLRQNVDCILAYFGEISPVGNHESVVTKANNIMQSMLHSEEGFFPHAIRRIVVSYALELEIFIYKTPRPPTHIVQPILPIDNINPISNDFPTIPELLLKKESAELFQKLCDSYATAIESRCLILSYLVEWAKYFPSDFYPLDFYYFARKLCKIGDGGIFLKTCKVMIERLNHEGLFSNLPLKGVRVSFSLSEPRTSYNSTHTITPDKIDSLKSRAVIIAAFEKTINSVDIRSVAFCVYAVMSALFDCLSPDLLKHQNQQHLRALSSILSSINAYKSNTLGPRLVEVLLQESQHENYVFERIVQILAGQIEVPSSPKEIISFLVPNDSVQTFDSYFADPNPGTAVDVFKLLVQDLPNRRVLTPFPSYSVEQGIFRDIARFMTLDSFFA